jgi:malonyl-CoA O-methyltransferase
MPPSYAESFRPPVDFARLRHIFDRRADGYDAVSFLPREIAGRMHERLDYIKIAPSRILDAGCGTGDDIERLRQRFATADVFGLDVSRRMVQRAARRGADQGAGGWRKLLPDGLRSAFSVRAGPRAVEADFARLPFASGAFDLLWSNLALHWHARPDLVLDEWARALRVGALLMFSTFGPDTLREVRAAWREADGGAEAARVIDFVDMHDFGDMLVASGFEVPVMDSEVLTVTYHTPRSLLADVRRWGGYPFETQARPAGLTARRRHDVLLAALDARRNGDGVIPLTFEVVYGHAWKSAPRTTPEGHGIVRLDDIGGRRGERR